MSEEQKAQEVPAVSAENDTQETQNQSQSPDVGNLIAQSKKYRSRAQSAESELAKMREELEQSRVKQMEEQEQWKSLAEERATKIAELEPIVAQAKQQEVELKNELLAQLPEEEHETFGELPINALRAVVNKLNTQRVAVSNAPSAPVNDSNVSLKNIKDQDRGTNWGNILESYKRKN